MGASAANTVSLLDTYYVRVLGLAYQVLGDAALATRAAETVFERLARSQHNDVVAVWRTALDVLRSYLTRGFTVKPLAPDTSGWQAALMDGLAKLESDERILLILRYHESLQHDQLAEVLGTDVAHVRQDVARARGHLMDILGLRDALY